MNLDRRLISFLRTVPLAFGITLGLGLGGGTLIILQASTLSQIIARVFLGGQGSEQVKTLLFVFLLIVSLRACFSLFYEVSSKALAIKLKERLREILFNHFLGLGPVSIRDEHTGELTATLVQGIEELDAYFSQYLPQLWLAVMIPLLILVFVFPMDLLTGVLLLLTAPLIPVFMILIGKTAEALTRKQWTALTRLSAHFLDSLRGIVTLKMFNQSVSQTKKIENISERYRLATLKVLRVTFLSALVLEMVGTLSTAIVAVEIGLRLLYGQMDFQQAFFILIIVPEFYFPLRLLGQRFHAGMGGIAAAKKIFAVLDSESLIKSQKLADFKVHEPPIETELLACHPFELTFDHVTYYYPGSKQPALEDVTFTVTSRQQTALVGASGSGKSTIAQLLLRFMEPCSGRILINGKSIQSISAADWRKQVAWVPQSPYFFNDTIAANIGLGLPEVAMDMVREAAQQANLHKWIESLPEGYLTQVGELGGRLSGGQGQRLALARAFLKNAPLVIMDEPTAHMDPDLEDQLQAIIRKLANSRTVITIAHRLSTIFTADQIILLERGKVIEIGKHVAMMQQGGRYFQLAKNYWGTDENL